jgi:riboflavin biosynthesis pyrimidine reductase
VHRLFPGPVVELDRDGLTTAYAVPDPPSDGSYVRANFVLSADGAAELGGSSRPLSTAADLRVLSLLRGLCDVVLVGAATVRAENYGPARPDVARQDWRRQHGLAPIPPIAVVSGRLDLDPRSRLFTQSVARPLLVTTESAAANRGADFAGLAEIVVAGATDLAGEAIVRALADRGLPRVLCEGGPRLFGQLLAAGLVDELCLTVSPVLVGGQAGRLLPAGLLPAPVPLELHHLLTTDGMLFVRYGVPRPVTEVRTRC